MESSSKRELYELLGVPLVNNKDNKIIIERKLNRPITTSDVSIKNHSVNKQTTNPFKLFDFHEGEDEAYSNSDVIPLPSPMNKNRSNTSTPAHGFSSSSRFAALAEPNDFIKDYRRVKTSDGSSVIIPVSS